MDEGTTYGGPALVVEGLGKRFGDQVAVEGLSFEVRAGEILGLLGPNGAGKTTTLRTISGVLPVQTGRVLVSGFDIQREERRAKECLAWMPDDPVPFDSLTIEEQLCFTARLYGIEGWKAKADHLLELLELGDKRHALGGELSRGMRQKLAICCAWLSEPRVALLDEPLSGLDPRAIRAARDAIRALADQGTAVILSSHLLELIDALADRLLIMDHGRGVFCGTPLEARRMLTSSDSGSLEEVFLAATSGTSRAATAARGPAALESSAPPSPPASTASSSPPSSVSAADVGPESRES